MLAIRSNLGVWYNGITHDSGSCNPGSIPGTPTEQSEVKKTNYLVFFGIR